LRLEFVNFRRDTIALSFVAAFTSAGVTGAHISIGMDSINPENTWGVASIPGGVTTVPITITLVKTPNFGYHYMTPLWHTVGGVQLNLAVSADSNGNRPTFRATLMPAESTTAVS
jgi:hypothetical protein